MNQDHINQLFEKLDLLLKRQVYFNKEIQQLKQEIAALGVKRTEAQTEIQKIADAVGQKSVDTPIKKQHIQPTVVKKQKTSLLDNFNLPKKKTDFEKFIGENLINKIGILITVIGVGIGAKYAIDNELISPLTRIILGYLVGLGLLGFGMKLKAKYKDFSAVLVSGAMAIMYFITFAAYSFYSIFPLSLTFILMLAFTVFTVVAALNYKKQVIAIIGLVGAYGVPFLLSSGSGRVDILFSYMLLINIGILFISVKKYWKLLYYISFIFTWLIFTMWFTDDYYVAQHFTLALVFATLFFIVFYATTLAYKLINNEKFGKEDVILMLTNSFIYFGLGLAILDSHDVGEDYLGLFALLNAIIHFVISIYLYKRKLADKNLFYLIAGLVLVFVTIAVPIQLDGNWVTLFWAAEAALLFWIGRTKGVTFYEKMAYPLLGIAFISFIQDRMDVSHYGTTETPIFNENFLYSLLFAVIIGFVVYIARSKKYSTPVFTSKIYKWMLTALPIALILVVFNLFKTEINVYFEGLLTASDIITSTEGYDHHTRNYNWNDFNVLWQFNYSFLFIAILAFFNYKKINNKWFAYGVLGALGFILVLFLTGGLYTLSNLREAYILQDSPYYKLGLEALVIRYISYLFVAIGLYAVYHWIVKNYDNDKWKKIFLLALHVPVLWILSSELIHWLDIAGSANNYKLGLSILWGVYALFLVAFGIWKNHKILRIGGIALFGITLIKLFFYDIIHLNTISKTIVFVSLGILLLIISFLYNKYKHKITDE